jgi:CelD/BcsL family acetyltransferase involved in cellulose biosynthesis
MIAPSASTGVEAAAPEWEELAERVNASPFLRPGWIAAWWRAFGSGRLEIPCERRSEDGRPCALVPVRRQRGTLASPTNWHTPESGVLAESAADARALVASLLEDGARRVSLAFLAPDQAELAAAEALARGYRVIRRTQQRSPHVPIAGDWEAYRNGLAKRFRDDLTRTRRLLRARGEVRLEVSTGAGDGHRAELLEQGFELESSGWKGARGTAIRSRPAARRFYTDVARWAAERGWLRLAFLRLGERPIAFDFCLEHARIHYLVKTGYDASFRELGPGKLLREEMLARAFREGLRSYELLGDAEPWKLRWTSATRARELVQAFRPSPLGLVDWSLYQHGRPLARLIRDLARGRTRVDGSPGDSAPAREA